MLPSRLHLTGQLGVGVGGGMTESPDLLRSPFPQPTDLPTQDLQGCGLHWIGHITARRGEEGSHAVLDDTGAEVHDSLGGLQLLDHFLLVHIHAEAEKYNKSMVKK